MTTNLASFALEGEDPRLPMDISRQRKQQEVDSPASGSISDNQEKYTSAGPVSVVGIHGHDQVDLNKHASIHEYTHWAKVSRLMEKDEKLITARDGNTIVPDSPLSTSITRMFENPHYHAQRALRLTTWPNVFFLVTTDILGPQNAPWAISQLGYVPGVLLYFFLGLMSVYTGWQIYSMFCGLDSYKYPLKTYSEIGHRVFGKEVKIAINVMQSVQLLITVATTILGNGNGTAEIAKYKVCYSVLIVVWAFAGMIIGQIRTLHRFVWLSNWAVWLNLFVIFATMGVVAHSGVNVQAAQAQNGLVGTPSIIHVAFPNIPLYNQVVGVMQLAGAYAGAMMFTEILAEMKRPWDFWKGMVMAQGLIFVCYLLYGLFVYSYQGQYTVNPGNQGIPNTWYGWQTATNAISLVSALISAGLYGNIGIKVIYQTFVCEIFHGPRLDEKKGKFLWIFFVLGYWSLAYVIASAIPQINDIGSLSSAAIGVQFTYTFPPLLKLGLDIKRDAAEADEYDETTGAVRQVDTWRNSSRWKRGITRQWYMKLFNLVIFVAGVATAGLGIYSSATALKTAYVNGVTTSFSCKAPI